MCRTLRNVPGSIFPSSEPDYFRCLRPLETVPMGAVCLAEFARCTKGSTCRVVQGLAPAQHRFRRFSAPPLPYCVRLRKRLQSCGASKFKEQCARKEDECRGGKCRKKKNGKGRMGTPLTHVSIGAPCRNSDRGGDVLPCAPG